MTINKTYTFSLDTINKSNPTPTMEFITGDLNTNVLIINLTASAVPLDITGYNAKISIQKADGNLVIQDSSNGVSILDEENGQIKVVLLTQSIAAIGINHADISIYNATDKLTTTNSFKFNVRQAKDENATISVNVIPVIDAALAEITALNNTMTTNEQARQSAEGGRVSAEAARQAGYENMLDKSFCIFKPSVANYAAIASSYPTPANGWVTRAIDTGIQWRYSSSSSAWADIGTIASDAYDVLVAEINSANKSTPQDYTQGVIPLPNTAVKGEIIIEVEGNTAYNIVKNGNFVNTTGWAPNTGTTISAANNELTCTIAELSASQGVYNAINTVAGHKYYFRYKINPKYNRAVVLGFVDDTTTIGTVTPDVWNTVSCLTTSTNASNAFVLYHNCMEDYVVEDTFKYQEVMGIDLTEKFGIGNEPTKAECEVIFPSWFDGLASVESHKIINTTKNINTSPVEAGTINTFGQNAPNTPDRIRSKDYIRVGAGQQITFSNDKNATGFAVFYYDSNFNFLSSSTSTTSTVPASATYCRYKYILAGSDITTKVQIEYGASATSSVDYDEKSVFVPVELRSTSIADTFHVNSGKHTKNNDEYVLQASDVTAYYTGFTNVNRITISRPTTSKGYGTQVVGYFRLEGFTETSNKPVQDSADYAGLFATDLSPDNNIYVFVAKGTYSDLASVKTALTGKKLLYQLADPIIEYYPAAVLNAYPSGTVLVESKRQETSVYTTKIDLLNTDYPISSLSKVTKIDVIDNIEVRTDIDLSTCTVATNGLSYTSTALTAKDVVETEYEYKKASQVPTLNISFCENLRAKVDGQGEQIARLDSKIDTNSHFTIAMLLNHEARLTAHSI